MGMPQDDVWAWHAGMPVGMPCDGLGMDVGMVCRGTAGCMQSICGLAWLVMAW